MEKGADIRARVAWGRGKDGKPPEWVIAQAHAEALQEARDRAYNRKKKLNDALHKAFKRRMNSLAFYPSTMRGARRK